MNINVQIESRDGLYYINLMGHRSKTVTSSKREALNTIGEMMDSLCAQGKCKCTKEPIQN